MATYSNILVWRIPHTKCLVGYRPWSHKESNMTNTHTVINHTPSDQKIAFFTWPINSFHPMNQLQFKVYDAKHCTKKDCRTKGMDGRRVVEYLTLSRFLRLASFIVWLP